MPARSSATPWFGVSLFISLFAKVGGNLPIPLRNPRPMYFRLIHKAAQRLLLLLFTIHAPA